MTNYLIQTLMGAIGAVCFAILFNVRGTRLLLFFLGGALDWAVYLVCIHFGSSMFLALFFATMTASLISEVLARIVHAPVLILLVPMLIPLVPGSDLYYTMDALVRKDRAIFLSRGTVTVTAAAAICLGIICMTAFLRIIFSIIDNIRSHRTSVR